MMELGFEIMANVNLEQEILFGRDAHSSNRRKALSKLLLNAGVDIETISKIIGVSKRQIFNYANEIRTKAEEKLYEDNRYRPVSELEKYKETIKAELIENPVATAKEASARILEITGIKIGVTQIRKFLHSIGLKPLKTAQIPAKADPEKQKVFLENELNPRLEEAKKDVRIILFVDAAHFVWQLYLGVLWCVERIFIRAASGRKRLNVLGAYDPIRNKLIKIINKTYITSTTVCELLEKIKEIYGEKTITIVLDNAKYQRCELVIKKAKSLGIELLFLPTYSPNLNLIERMWKLVKKKCLYSKYYKTFKEFEEGIENCLDEIDTKYKEDIASLMTLKFQLFDDIIEKVA